MPGPHVMVIDEDPLMLRAIRRAVRWIRPDWTLALVPSPVEALEALEARPADVVVADLALTWRERAALAELARRHPEALRVLFTTDPDRTQAIELTSLAHRIVAKGPNPQELVASIDDALTARAWMDSAALRRVVFGARDLPRAPELAPQLALVARDPKARVKDLAEVVSRDPAVASRVLRIASSVWFASSRRLRSLEEAIARVGVRTLQALVLDTEIAHRFRVHPRSGVSADALARHSFRVARTALRIASDVAPPLAEVAFLAGVVHEVGQLVLAEREPERIGRDRELARRRGVPLHEIEAERHGVTHATVGAALLHLWSFDERVVTGVLEHHRAPSRRTAAVDVATILWVAQAVAQPAEEVGTDVPAELAKLGWGTRFSGWREVVDAIA